MLKNNIDNSIILNKNNNEITILPNPLLYDCLIFYNKLKCPFKGYISSLMELKEKIIKDTELNISPSLLLIYHNKDDCNSTCENIFLNLLPPLCGPLREQPFLKQVINIHHQPAYLKQFKFTCLKNQKLKIYYSSLWLFLNLAKETKLWYTNENDIASHVAMVIRDILAGGQIKAECKVEIGIYSVTSIIWLISNSYGLPIGIVQFKKPNEIVLNNPFVCGELLNYMLILKEMYGQKNVFGISTTYNQWRIYWLPDSEADQDDLISKTESNTKLEYPSLIPIENNLNEPIEYSKDSHNIYPQSINRVIYGTKLYNFSSEELPMVLLSTLKKMFYSERKPEIELLDKKRLYMQIDKYNWYWVNIRIDSLKYLINLNFDMVRAAVVLLDLSEKSGKVWLCSTVDGYVFVLKFSSGENFTETGEELKNESMFWKLFWDFNAKVNIFNNRPALMMPFLLKASEDDWKNDEFVNQVLSTISNLASNGNYYHCLSKRKVGKYIDKNNKKNVAFFDLSFCEYNRNDKKEIENLMKNSLFNTC
ncbi:hypothetical protein DICPUDRAFT_158253 [Dictyostelium purpureum]|uniref:DUF5898 domain-containing protein n=1 Tax=Dictyostelium purpureum TaxID=5786 RepID=F1A166_DICPU|nr:uncharacterized protein DICPUDRAFT_158253 [Dictyostelium purpureum]EGC30063.1 hypothetical protein DICPUDRAFT_158253 [Dictyostelium purpureum]|eukprot:XP_003293409.1 hypothetical protein DICPUDRAFT_158253 [Dictyostelium purpureum]